MYVWATRGQTPLTGEVFLAVETVKYLDFVERSNIIMCPYVGGPTIMRYSAICSRVVDLSIHDILW